MELDDELRNQLAGKVDGRLDYTERFGKDGKGGGFHNVRERYRWQGSRKVPPFALDDGQLKSVLCHVTLIYVFRNKKVPKGLATDLAFLDGLARDRQERWRSTIDGRADEYWDRFHHNLEILDNAGGYMALISAIAYRSYRLKWHADEIADSLGLTVSSVRRYLSKFKNAADLLGFDAGFCKADHRSSHITLNEILPLWQSGKTIKQIVQDLGSHTARIRFLLRKEGVWKQRKPKMAPGKRYAPLTRLKVTTEQIAKVWNENPDFSYKQAAEKLGISCEAVFGNVKRAGLGRHFRSKDRLGRQAYDQEKHKRIPELWNAGFSFNEIASELGISYQSVVRRLVLLGLHIPKTHTKPVTSPT